MATIKGKAHSVAELKAVGVRRVITASSLRAAMAALRDAGREIRDTGTFRYLDRAVRSRRKRISLRQITSPQAVVGAMIVVLLMKRLPVVIADALTGVVDKLEGTLHHGKDDGRCVTDGRWRVS